MEKATEPYTNHSNEVEDLLMEVKKMIEYEKNKENNELTYKMFNLIGDENKNLLAGYLKRWKDKDKLSAIFIQEATPQIQEAFDVILKYESKKNKENESNLLKILSNN